MIWSSSTTTSLDARRHRPTDADDNVPHAIDRIHGWATINGQARSWRSGRCGPRRRRSAPSGRRGVRDDGSIQISLRFDAICATEVRSAQSCCSVLMDLRSVASPLVAC